jgi:hypothetical protein
MRPAWRQCFTPAPLSRRFAASWIFSAVDSTRSGGMLGLLAREFPLLVA